MSARPQSAAKPAWFKSSYSGGNATECVEAAFIPTGVLIRDSKQPEGPLVAVSTESWRCFVAASTH
ncbi:DUF397 domain-containing protein [Streptomyces griseorubiginosus]|uniref:DUF397 domain-containing protein n=1 Tax=Streptomyces griseorubiginosus TaxID=67304 RepID=UPI002E80DB6A|nr:DUF397 domain-containing protein [Streptomyces griseorubiginosus]WUB46783.1 DUF397 domain-containing protein [Streptomyces griseorubiginosus]WUB55305.1 DUF397 domain-containing protein [Streptomyces griseorubiginosus]